MNVKRHIPKSFKAIVTKRYYNPINEKIYNIGDHIQIIDRLGNMYCLNNESIDIIPSNHIRKVKKNVKKKTNLKK